MGKNAPVLQHYDMRVLQPSIRVTGRGEEGLSAGFPKETKTIQHEHIPMKSLLSRQALGLLAIVVSTPALVAQSNTGVLPTPGLFTPQTPALQGGGTPGPCTVTGFVGDTTLAGGWTAFEGASGAAMEVISSGLADFTDFTNLPSSAGDLVWNTTFNKRTIGSGWGSWSHGYGGEIYYSNGATVATLDLPPGINACDFYVEPNPFSLQDFTVTGNCAGGGSTMVNISASGSSGASHAGFYTSGADLVSVTISSDMGIDFAVGELRIGLGGGGCTSNDDCACATSIAGEGDFAFDTTAATQDGPPDAACFKFGTSDIDNDVWFRWTADGNCDYTVTTCNGTLGDTKIAIYDGADCGALSIIDCNDDTCGLQSSVFAPGLTAGNSYLIRIGSFPGALGTTGTFNVSGSNCGAINNDNCEDCTPLSGLGTFDYDNTGFTTDGPADVACDKFGTSQVENDAWFCYTAGCSGLYTFDTCLSLPDTKIAIYDTDDCGDLAGTILDCNDDTCGLQSQISADLVGGQTYLLRLGNFAVGAGGPSTLNISGPSAGSSNYCEAGVNCDGERTQIGFSGSASVAANDFTLEATQVSSCSRFGLFVFGDTQTQVPFEEGFLCIDVSSNFNRLNPILNYNGVDSLSRPVDLTSAPANVITAGSTWNFQFWYRDMGQTNLSDGLSVCFAP